MIKCPNCGSTAQVRLYLEVTENKRQNSEKKISFYSCGCGVEFEMAQQYINGEPIGEAEVWDDE